MMSSVKLALATLAALIAVVNGAGNALIRTEELDSLKPAMDCSKCWECFGCVDDGSRCMPIPGCVPSGCDSNTDCGRGQKCENGECIPATIHCNNDGDCLTTDHYCDGGACELRGKGGKSAPAPKKSKSGSKSRSSSRDRGSGGGHSGSRSASAEHT